MHNIYGASEKQIDLLTYLFLLLLISVLHIFWLSFQKHNLSRNQTLNLTVSLAPPPPSTSDTSSRRRAKPITDLGGNHNPIAFSFLNLMGVFQSSKFLPMGIPLLSWLFFFTHIFIISVSGQCLHEQKSLLLQLKNNLTFNISISTKLTNWNQTLDCCKWNGVTCDQTGYITGLDLNSESISNGIDYSITLFSLMYLEALNLANNSFNSTAIPSSIGNLTNLVYLNLSDSGFSGQIPIELSLLTRLVTLDLSTTTPYFPPIQSLQIQNPNLSTLFGNLSGVKELHLDGVNISADGYEWGRAISSSLPNLRVLSLSSCSLSGPIDSSLQNLHFLSEINLNSNNLSAPVPDFLANFVNLTALSLSYCNLYGTFPAKILEVKTLQTLDLSDNQLLQGSLPMFHQNGTLQNLVLSYTNFSGILPDSIGNLRKLARIEISNCSFSGRIPNTLANLTQLVYLDLSYNMFTGGIPSFQTSNKLSHLRLSHNALTGPVPSIYFEGLPNLVSINLGFNSFNGCIPSSLFSLPSMQEILLSNNQFYEVSGFLPNGSSSALDTLDLSSNKLQGPLPSYFLDFQSLIVLSLSFNNFNGTIQLESIQRLPNLHKLDLSYNSLTVNASVSNSALSSFPQLTILGLASCKLQTFPPLMNQSLLFQLDLSNNHISGVIPNWIWNIGDGFLARLNLSCNLLVGLQPEYVIPTSLTVLDLHSNQLGGEIPLPSKAVYVDYSSNNFNSSIPAEVGIGIAFASFFSLSDNMLSGPIPPSICNGSYLQVLDLSNNRFNDTIPQCLIDSGSATLGVLDLKNNSLTGNISGTFAEGCALRTLDLNGNHLEGQIPKSLAKCANAEVLNFGFNNINGNFPCFLTNLSSLHVFILRSNKFHGNISCGGKNIWPKVQIIDLALNNFSGTLPPQFFLQMKAMMDGGKAQPDLNHLRFEFLKLNNFYYQDSVTVINKGFQMKLVKILAIFNAIDFSSNSFTGEIPDIVGDLRSLYVLNVSHNALTGSIPSSLGNLTQLGSLDLSWNKLCGSIPMKLASLTFLSFINLSYNQLVGMIPIGPQLQTFSETSFQGNKGLCGAPLIASCGEEEPTRPTFDGRQEDEINWVYITATLGYTLGFGVIVGPLLYSKRWRQCYYKPVDRAILRIRHHRERQARHERRRDNRNQLRRRQHH